MNKVKSLAEEHHLPFTYVAACHRVNGKENSHILIRFVNLSDKDRWIKKVKNLKGRGSNYISFAHDVPPCVRPQMNILLQKRKENTKKGEI